MFKVFTALFLFLILVAFQNCSGKMNSSGESAGLGDSNISGFKLVSTTPVTADTMILGEGYSPLMASSLSVSPYVMPAPADVRVELRMNKDELAKYEMDSFNPPRFCNLAANPEYLELKALLLEQKICHFKSVISESERMANAGRCMMLPASGTSYSFSLYSYAPGVSSELLTSLSRRRAYLESSDPYCVTDYISFCTDTISDRIYELAQSLVGQILTLSDCRDDTRVGIPEPLPLPKPIPEEPIPMPKLPGI